MCNGNATDAKTYFRIRGNKTFSSAFAFLQITELVTGNRSIIKNIVCKTGNTCSTCLKYDIKVHTAFFKAAVNWKLTQLLDELQKKYFMKKSLPWAKHTQIGDGGKVRVVKVVKL